VIASRKEHRHLDNIHGGYQMTGSGAFNFVTWYVHHIGLYFHKPLTGKAFFL